MQVNYKSSRQVFSDFATKSLKYEPTFFSNNKLNNDRFPFIVTNIELI